MEILKHKCKEWKGDVKIIPDCNWLWGTHLEYCDREIKDKNGGTTKDFWTLMDDTSQTFSIWTEKHCPFCKIELKTLIFKE